MARRSIYLLSFATAFWFSCANKDRYYIHHTKFDRGRAIVKCNPELVDQINTNWLRHGRSNCHYYNAFAQDLPRNYKDCLLGQDTRTIVRLFGKPSEFKNGRLAYTVSFQCMPVMKQYSLLLFNYDKQSNKITDVSFGSYVIND